MKLIKGAIDRFEEIFGSLLLVLLCGVASIQAGSRFLSKFLSGVKPVFWTEEACTLLFIWLCFVGASLALKTGDHFAVEVIREKLPAKTGAALHLLGLVVVVLFAGSLLWHGGFLTANSSSLITPSLQIPKSIPCLAIPVGGILMLLRSLQMLVRRVALLRNGNREEQTV